MSLPSDFDSFMQLEFSNFSGIAMNGQTLSVDFVFSKPFQVKNGPVWSEVFLQTGPHNAPNSSGDYPYDQYVVFGPGTRAYLIDQNGNPLDTPMTDWQGGTTNAPAATLGVLLTGEGWAGADMIAYPSQGNKVAGIHYDLVLPNTGQTLVLGRIGLKIGGTPGNSDSGNPNGGSGSPTPAITVTIQTGSAASINWTTSGADTVVEYGTTKSYGQRAVPQAQGEHSVNLDGLSANTTYHFRITSRDADGNIVQGEDNTFITGFSIPNSGGLSRTSDGYGSLVPGYGRIKVGAGTTPSGLVIFGNRQSDVLVNEVAVPATPLTILGRTYAEASADGLIRTGIAIANPNTRDATINFEFRNAEGNIYRSGTFTLKGIGATCDPNDICNHLSRFVDEYPFLSGRNIEGTLSFASTAPISVIAVRSFYNERTPSDFLMAAQPVVDLSVATPPGIQVIPQFAVGNGMRTQLELVNPTGKTLRGRLELLNSSGAPAIVKAGSDYVNTLPYTIEPNGVQKFVIAEGLIPVDSGSVWVIPEDDNPAPIPLAILSYKPVEITVAEAGVPATMGTAFRIYVQLSNSPKISAAVAIANATDMAGSVMLSLTNLDGDFVASASRDLPARGQIMGLLDSLIPSLKGRPLQGILRITTDLPGISVAGFRERYNERRPNPDFLFTTIAPILENAASSSQESVFPQLANGEGFSTEIILYSGTAGSISEGSLNFVQPDGTPFNLDIH